jgi:AraC-like DNA-binding protein
MDAVAGTWKKENIIMRNSLKINVFVEGSFSVFSDEMLHYPIYGDICFLPPMKMHYGQITKQTHINYYQLDIGRDTFSTIPDGKLLIDRLIDLTAHADSFLRPSPEKGKEILRLCGEIETALRKEEAFLAYAKVLEFLSMLYPLYQNPTNVARADFSLRTSQIIRYIEKHYAEDVTITEIATELGVSASFLSRIFKKEIGIPIHEYLNQYRISKSLSLLKTHSITEVGYICGFCDNSHFISIFKKYIGTTPMQYKKQHS